MTVEQWENVSEAVKARRTNKYVVRGCARKWCNANNVDLETGFRGAVNEGRWKFDWVVIQCIGFNTQVYQTLRDIKPVPFVEESSEE